jgi:peptidyl-prolyl cis-trans isomerase D
MLQRIRDSLGRWVAGIILGLLAITFIFWGVGDFSLTGTTFAAKVNGDDIPLSEFDRELQAQQNQYLQVYRTELTDDLRRELRRNVLERMVRDEVLKQRVDEAGYRISDERLTDYIRSAAAFQVDGEFSIEIYRGLLANQGLTPTGFETLQREQLEILELQNGIADSAFLTPAEFRRYIELYNQRREVGYALFDVEAFTPAVEIDDAAITEHYQNNQQSYQTVETVDLEYVELAQADIAAVIEITEEDLQRFYEEERSRFETVEERRARHILINAGDDPETARAAAEGAAERIRNGEDFAAVAMEVSDDAGTKTQGGDLGWIGRGMLAGPFEDALFEMQIGDVRGPVQTTFGFHVIRLDEVRAGDLQPYAAVRDELLAEYQARRAEEIYYDRANELADGAFDAYDELASVAAELGLQLKTLSGFPRSGDPAAFANSAPVVQAAFDIDVLETRRNSPLVELAEDHVLVLRVTEHRPSTLQPLEAVRDQIREELTRSRAQQLAEQAASVFLAELQMGGDPAALAEAGGGVWNPVRPVERTDAQVPTEVLAAAFGLPKPASGELSREAVALANGGHAVLVLSSVQPGQPETVAQAERDQRQRQLADQTASAELVGYAGDLRDRATVRIPEEILEPRF